MLKQQKSLLNKNVDYTPLYNRPFGKHEDVSKFYDECMEFLLNSPYYYTQILHFINMQQTLQGNKFRDEHKKVLLKDIVSFSRQKEDVVKHALLHMHLKGILIYKGNDRYFIIHYIKRMTMINKSRKRHTKLVKKLYNKI